jgi:hypothetical protein
MLSWVDCLVRVHVRSFKHCCSVVALWPWCLLGEIFSSVINAVNSLGTIWRGGLTSSSDR